VLGGVLPVLVLFGLPLGLRLFLGRLLCTHVSQGWRAGGVIRAASVVSFWVVC
jgi:hypothetical protein